MEKRKTGKGYSFTLDREKMLATCELSAEDKLNWLEEANLFVYSALGPRKYARWKKLRKEGVF